MNGKKIEIRILLGELHVKETTAKKICKSVFHAWIAKQILTL